MDEAPLAKGTVRSLCLNGEPVDYIDFYLDGPENDRHRGFKRKLSGHDGGYIRTSSLRKGEGVFNWRMWTGISAEEINEVEQDLGLKVPQGCLLENLTISGIPNFSQLRPTTRLVFPVRYHECGVQCVLAVWEENSPCRTVAERLEACHQRSGLKKDFIAAAQGKRGVMGLVLSPGRIRVGDPVLAYLPL